jgi:anti-anti-sigma factor
VEPKGQEDRIAVAIVGRTALVRVEGRGSFKVSTSLKEFAQAAIEGGATAAVIDLARCVSMDSTFMGVLAGTAGRIQKRNQGQVILVNLAPKTRALIATLGLDQVVAAYDVGLTPEPYRAFVDTARVVDAAPGPTDKRELTKTMLEAHETLTELNPENAPRFKDVLEYLREDIRKHDGSGGSTA